MGHHGRMHAQPGVGLRPDAPWGYLPATSFRSRRSALSEAQRQTWERLWPQLGRQADDTPPGQGAPLDTESWFGRRAPLVLEIGCGSGTSTLAMAQAEPDIDVIAVEIYRRGLAQLLCAIDAEQVSNIRLIRGNGIDVLKDLLTAQSLIGVRVFFPDPWPKARHHKRRLLQPGTVSLIADRLLPGGVLHVATDHPGYAEHIEEVGAQMEAQSRFVRAGTDSESLPISVNRPTTKYETKAQEAGSHVCEFVWKRI
ncbi:MULTISPECIES: tRNA (guanosine(46)-N7)-methyltransferase TrmB [unclassified Mycobacterium]|uniref:tRNA (guanosine(46)-N7)-methyltransferase TrmB n=1 Tax=unclassified Mycobacterium TaxID=2642494 RepID=UPI00274199B1|nr:MULTISPECIES: tRNA (guanosine(46)-N7)-methyltransferase TrmB [unclassified Mycobacterium]MDP7704443.1 tRNA (guanosine(46)-N7)-methyltransferase TrmB [Mycobacterium sp. TY815]MDP7722913.1 tRNA (guanosine(46)-N7)-methyltransferase TrmB [Mycobacterium sp. TY814]